MATVENYLDRYRDPVNQTFCPGVARRILALKAGADVLTRVRQLGDKSHAGALTDAECDEHKSPAEAGTLIALVKAKFRRFLANHST